MLTTTRQPWFTAHELHACALREAKARRVRYANKVLTGRMTQAKADSEISMMQTIADHFANLAKKERLL